MPGKAAKCCDNADHFINRETVRACTRFVPKERTAALPAQKKTLERRLKPTPGLETGDPSLRGKDE
jgi:hypothetical protein